MRSFSTPIFDANLNFRSPYLAIQNFPRETQIHTRLRILCSFNPAGSRIPENSCALGYHKTTILSNLAAPLPFKVRAAPPRGMGAALRARKGMFSPRRARKIEFVARKHSYIHTNYHYIHFHNVSRLFKIFIFFRLFGTTDSTPWDSRPAECSYWGEWGLGGSAPPDPPMSA